MKSVDGQGQDAFRRTGPVSEHLANERTFLAWIRTSIAILTLGFVVAKFSVWLRQFLATLAASSSAPVRSLPASGASLPMGLVLMALGAATAHGLSTLVTVTVIVVAVVLIVYLYGTSARI